MTTRTLQKGKLQRKYSDIKSLAATEPVQLGTIQRPRICIIPAVIIFLFFLTLAALVRLRRGRQDLAFKQWAYISLSHWSPNMENPLFADWEEFSEWKLSGTRGFLQQYNARTSTT